MLLTSCKEPKIKDTDTSAVMVKRGNSTADGMDICYKETLEYAETDKGVPSPDNIRSNSADRIKCYRKGISWGSVLDKREEKRSSAMFKQSAIMLIQCVLSSVYGENITLSVYKVDSLKGQKNYPGRDIFLDDIVDALYGREKEDPGMKMKRNEM